MSTMKIAAAVATAVIAALSSSACGASSTGADAERAESDTDDRSIEAAIMCEKFVKQRLDAPATAEFPRSEQRSELVNAAQQRYDVAGKVDAENAFGALLRTTYVCELRSEEDGETWTLLNSDAGLSD